MPREAETDLNILLSLLEDENFSASFIWHIYENMWHDECALIRVGKLEYSLLFLKICES